jgi:hypothetical protein
MSVLAKFKCEANNQGSVTLRAVYDPNPESENGRFFQYTPSGMITLSTVNEFAAKQFVPGKEYFVTFETAEVPASL